MKTTLSMIIIVFFMIFAIASNTFAQDYTQWGLPEGAKARFGKGFGPEWRIHQMAVDLQLGVASVFGSMTHGPVKKLICLQD